MEYLTIVDIEGHTTPHQRQLVDLVLAHAKGLTYAEVLLEATKLLGKNVPASLNGISKVECNRIIAHIKQLSHKAVQKYK